MNRIPEGYSNYQSKETKKSDYSALGTSLRGVDWSKSDHVTVKKNFYIEHESVKNRSPEEIALFRKNNSISVKGTNVPQPVTSFEESQFPKYILDEIKKLGFEKPTPIQSQGWPVILSGKDVVGIAETGSGKTLAYALPAIVHINDQPLLNPGEGPIVLVIVPTRELAIQILVEFKRFAQICRVSCAVAYGGVPRGAQQRELEKGVDILIATPGRLIDFMEAKVFSLKHTTYVVLDEADRMLDMGFEKYIKKVLAQVRPDRQMLMLSATWPLEVRELATTYCNEELVHISIGVDELKANPIIKQSFFFVDDDAKPAKLVTIIGDISSGKILVFCNTKVGLDDLLRELRREGIDASALHSGKSQEEREQLIKDYKSGKCNIMLATDVASRGLDVKDIGTVINYDFPNQLEDYIHRIGRTGRAGNQGTAYSFFSKKNFMLAPGLIKLLKEAKKDVPDKLYDFAKIAQSTESSNVQLFRKWRKDPNQPEEKVIEDISQNEPTEALLNSTEKTASENNDIAINGEESHTETASAKQTKKEEEFKMPLPGVSMDTLRQDAAHILVKQREGFQNYFKADKQDESQSTASVKLENPANSKKWGKKK